MRILALGLSLCILIGCGPSNGGTYGFKSSVNSGSTAVQPPVPTSTTGTSSTTTTGGSPTNTVGKTVPPANCTTSTPTDPNLAFALNILNADRAKYGSPPLLLDTCECACSTQHSIDLSNCVGGNLSLVGTSGPGGGTGCAHMDFRNGNTCGSVEENQGMDPTSDFETAFQVIDAAMMAEGVPTNGTTNHCTNIINPAMVSVSIGYYYDQYGYMWVTEDFQQ
jgi:hypothetical protein